MLGADNQQERPDTNSHERDWLGVSIGRLILYTTLVLGFSLIAGLFLWYWLMADK